MKLFYSIIILLLSTSAYAGELRIVAHRGASQEAPQNTMPAFKLAWKQGADAIEGDFHLTKDGHIVCIHDKDTKSVANTNLVISKSTLAELRKVDVGVRKDKASEGVIIPTIAEVFSTIPDKKTVYIEIKCDTEIIPTLLEEIDDSGLTGDQIVVISFKSKVLKELKERAPDLKVAWLCAFKKDKTSGITTPSLETVLETLKLIKADAISSNTRIPKTFIDSIKKQGYEWHVWTVNDLPQAKHMKTLGVKSITTDLPGHLKSNLIEQDASLDADKPHK